MPIIQWVNLEKDSDYLDDPDIDSLDRCGKLTIKTAFSKSEPAMSYKVKVTPDPDNVTYSDKELGRNSNFKMTKGATDLANGTEVLLEDTIQLPAAGGNKYKLEVKGANGTTVLSEEVEAKRRLYCQFMTMNDANGYVPTYSLLPMKSHLEKYHIYQTSIGSAVNIPYYKTIHDENSVAFAAVAKKLYTLPEAMKGVGVAIIYSDYIADYTDMEFSKTINIGSEDPDIVIGNNDITIIFKKFLWFGFDKLHDKSNKFFIDGLITYESSTGDQLFHFIDPKEVEIAGSKLKTHGGFHKIKINKNKLLAELVNKPAGSLKFQVEVNIVASWTNGFSWNPWSDNFHLITVSRRPMWEDMTNAAREQVWNHEVGHRIGMTAYGNKFAHDGSLIPGYNKLPDGPSTFYYDVSDKLNYGGHRGPHCRTGATYDPVKDSWSGNPKCVMFGADAIGTNNTSPDYCPECAKIPRKLDLSK